MLWGDRISSRKLRPKKSLLAAVLLAAGFLMACGQERPDMAAGLSGMGTPASGEDTAAAGTGGAGAALTPGEGGDGAVQGTVGQGALGQGSTGQGTPEQGNTGQVAASEQGTEGQAGAPGDSSGTSADGARSAELKRLFGESCIAEQTFEVKLSEYSGKVWFVPYMPSADNPDFRMQIIQDGEVLREITAYVPEELAREKFGSLDAVSFFDINYDDITDIVLIETYGNTTFAAVYYGHNDGFGPYFISQDQLSAELSRQVEPLTVPGIRSFLSDGKRNGGFSDYQEAYRAVARLYEMEDSNERKYDLIYIDDDEIPELVAGVNGYYVSLYTYSEGKVYRLMDDWGYGAMGNFGYNYVPERNWLRNYNTDYAGAILYTTYMTVTQGNVIDVSMQIKVCNFDDTNGNGAPDGNEWESLGRSGAVYIDGEEVPEGEQILIPYEGEEYEFIEGRMSLDELLAELNGQ